MADPARSDPYDLARFFAAQERHGTYSKALGELRSGQKHSHWMWFIFPQLAGLGHSTMARHYAITGLAEARALLAHPVLGPRLGECTEAVLRLGERRPEAVFGGVDALKLRSSMTLFARAAPEREAFAQVLEQWYGGEPDPLTERLLANTEPKPEAGTDR